MTIKHRRLLAAAFILIFIIAAPILVMHTAGFRFNFKKIDWQKTGSIFIETEPKSADIFLNGKKIQSKTPAIINALYPDIYNIRVEKDGFVSWERNLEVAPEKASIAKDIVLIPKEIKRQKEAVYPPADSPVANQKGGSFIYEGDFWKFHPEKNEPKNDYALEQNQTENDKTLLSAKHRIRISKIPEEASEILETDGASFAIFKDENNGILIGSIKNNEFEKIDYLKNANDFFWDGKNSVLTVSADLELIQYRFSGEKIEKNMIMRGSSDTDRLLVIPDSIYIIILQKEQIKIIENGSFGIQIIPLISLETDEKLIFWEMNKRFNISIWTQSGEALRHFEISPLK